MLPLSKLSLWSDLVSVLADCCELCVDCCCCVAEAGALPSFHLQATKDGAAGFGLHGPRSAEQLQVQSSQRHVFPGTGHLRCLQRGPFDHRGQSQLRHLSEAAGDGKQI